jgi:hypothetical protein
MRAFIVITTKGRPKETRRLLDHLQRQTHQPDFTVIVGTNERDLEGIGSHPWIRMGHGEAMVSPRTGLTIQRNVGLEFLEKKNHFVSNARFLCAFFDDDYRPADDWIRHAVKRFEMGDIVGLTGQVLADGLMAGGLTDDQADAFLKGQTPPQAHWASGTSERDTASVYGCNMAFVDTVIRTTRFDEALALYGWQEDRDYTGMAWKHGRVIYYPSCRGVHLGTRSGRVSGVKFGYSQIANPVYLMKKGTMDLKTGPRFIARALAANSIRSLQKHPFVDYRGRLRGNMRALLDVIALRSDPRNIVRA